MTTETTSPFRPARDAALIRRVQQGDAAALGDLFEAHGSAVLGLLTRMLGRAGEAEEVLQETFLQAWRKAGDYRAEAASVRGWLLVIARSRALDRLRARTSARRRDAEAGLQQPVVEAPRATEDLERGERRRCVRRALGILSGDQRECIELAFFEGLTHSQIADRLAAPLGTVKSRILLGMRKLRDALAECR